MSLISQLDAALRTAAAPAQLAVTDGSDRLECDLQQVDSIGVAVDQVRFGTPRLAGRTSEQLKMIAQALTQRLTYLLEPIAPIEFDAVRSSVQLRSRPPRRSEAVTSYYEILVEVGGQITLVRYDKPRGEQRQRVPYLVTREVLLRIVDDFVAAV